MVKDNFSVLASKVDALQDSIDILIKLTALNIGKNFYFKDKERKEERIEALAPLEIPDKILALVVGSSPESIQVLRNRMKNKKGKTNITPTKATKE